MENLKIKELIHAVRQELIESEEERIEKGIPPSFTVDNLKIEVNFVVEKKTETGGGLNLKIVEVGRDITYCNQQIHKISLELKTCFVDNSLATNPNSDNEKRKKIDKIKKSVVGNYPIGVHPIMPLPEES